MSNTKAKILILATTASMIEQFNMHNIKILQSLGAEVHVGTNFTNPGTITKTLSKRLINKLEGMEVKWHQIDFMRGIGTHQANRAALKEVCAVIQGEGITGIHAHSPLGGIIGRRAAHKMGIKLIYTVHGLQFFKGGPLKNWLLFFPVEWFYARWTDAIITINKDDFAISKYLPAGRTYYIPGVGTDILSVEKIPAAQRRQLRQQMRKRLSVSDSDYLILSVGELSKRKNHETVLKAIKKLNNPRIKYVIAGIGAEKDHLLDLIDEYHLNHQVQLLGYKKDLTSLYFAADLNVFISTREGLGLGGLDGVAHGLYMIGNRNTGMSDYVTSDRIGMLVKSPLDVDEVAACIKKAMDNSLRVTDFRSIRKFDHSNVDQLMRKIYKKEFNL